MTNSPGAVREMPLATKYPYVCHAELNAVLNGIGDLSGCAMYTALFPCNECAKVIIQAGIEEVVYLSDKYADTDSVKASKIMFQKAGVAIRKLAAGGKEIRIRLSE
jgi:dCMP deaminase